MFGNSAARNPRVPTGRLTNIASAQVGRPLRHRRMSAVARHSLRALAVTLILLVLALGTGLAVIFSGPTEFSVIRDRVQALLASDLGPDYVVEIGRSVVDVDPALGLVVEIDDVVVRDRRDSVVARVPSTRLAIDPLALLRLQVEVSTVELSSAQLSFVRSAAGEVYLGDADTVLSAVAASATNLNGVPRNGGGNV